MEIESGKQRRPEEERQRVARPEVRAAGTRNILANAPLVWIVTFSKYPHIGSRLIIAIRLFAHRSP
jgi:hypothetical protein